MNFEQYRKLKRLVYHTSSFSEFLEECAKWHKYAVVSPKIWTKADYQWFYDRIKGGHNYESLFHVAKAA